MERTTPDLFLCHSHADKEFVRQLARDLHELSVYVWFDEWELLPGGSFHGSIGKALEESSYVSVVISPDSVESEWCRKELWQALSRETRQGRPVVIPLLFRSSTLPPFLEDKLYIDFRSEYLTSLVRLAGYIHGVDNKRLTEALPRFDLPNLEEARLVLKEAGWKDTISVGSHDWRMLTEIFERHGVPIKEDRLSVLPDRLSKKRYDMS